MVLDTMKRFQKIVSVLVVVHFRIDTSEERRVVADNSVEVMVERGKIECLQQRLKNMIQTS
jgi:hypothetical protein